MQGRCIQGIMQRSIYAGVYTRYYATPYLCRGCIQGIMQRRIYARVYTRYYATPYLCRGIYARVYTGYYATQYLYRGGGIQGLCNTVFVQGYYAPPYLTPVFFLDLADSEDNNKLSIIVLSLTAPQAFFRFYVTKSWFSLIALSYFSRFSVFSKNHLIKSETPGRGLHFGILNCEGAAPCRKTLMDFRRAVSEQQEQSEQDHGGQVCSIPVWYWQEGRNVSTCRVSLRYSQYSHWCLVESVAKAKFKAQVNVFLKFRKQMNHQRNS